MDQPFILTIDQGTHASKALLFDSAGHLVDRSSCEIGLVRQHGGIVEQDPSEILNSVRRVVNNILKARHGIIKCAGLATQRSTVVAWDVLTGQPLAPAISWQDTRTETKLARYSKYGMMILQKTGLRISPHYGATKLRWYLDNIPAIFSASEKNRLAFGPLSSFLLYKLLVGKPLVVDHSNASRTLLFNLSTCDWDEDLLNLFGIKKSWLPACFPVRYPYGIMKDSGIALKSVDGDQGAMLFCNGHPRDDVAYINSGTGAFLLVPTNGEPLLHSKLLTGIADSNSKNPTYVVEGTVNGAGSAFEWLRQTMGVERRGNFSSGKSVPIFVNTVGGLGSPWWISGIQPYFVGDDESTSPLDYLSAVEESIVFMLKANLDLMLGSGLKLQNIQATGGLSQSNSFCQKLADLSGLAVMRLVDIESTARGIAWLACDNEAPWSPNIDTNFSPEKDDGLVDRYYQFIKIVESLKRQSDEY